MSKTDVNLALSHLDELWFQVAGTRCNLTCHHCFISCSPHNNRFGFLSREKIQTHLHESIELGVKGYYFTGGEPFMIEEHFELLRRTVEAGHADHISLHYNTNGTIRPPQKIFDLWKEFKSCEVMFSIDGTFKKFEYMRHP